MDRNVYRIRRLEADGTDEPPAHEKLLKYFPEAALALYVTLDPLLRQVAEGTALNTLLWVALGLAVVFCWLYLGRFWNVTRASQKVVSAVALVLYVAAIGGPFSTLPWYETIYGMIAAVVATAFLIFRPSPEPPASKAA